MNALKIVHFSYCINTLTNKASLNNINKHYYTMLPRSFVNTHLNNLTLIHIFSYSFIYIYIKFANHLHFSLVF